MAIDCSFFLALVAVCLFAYGWIGTIGGIKGSSAAQFKWFAGFGPRDARKKDYGSKGSID